MSWIFVLKLRINKHYGEGRCLGRERLRLSNVCAGNCAKHCATLCHLLLETPMA